ncbi:hypothetical protein STEG23_002205, partial [Scotinomys teguina]
PQFDYFLEVFFLDDFTSSYSRVFSGDDKAGGRFGKTGKIGYLQCLTYCDPQTQNQKPTRDDHSDTVGNCKSLFQSAGTTHKYLGPKCSMEYLSEVEEWKLKSCTVVQIVHFLTWKAEIRKSELNSNTGNKHKM